MRENNGITLLSLMITIALLIVLSSVTVYSSKKAIKRAQLEELRTNMLFIEGKAKEYVVEANFKIGMSPTDDSKKEEYENKKQEIRKEIYEGEALLQKVDASEYSEIDLSDNCYKVTKKTLEKWELGTIEIDEGKKDTEKGKKGDYLIDFDDENSTVQIYNTKGYDGKYSLLDIEAIE